MLGPCHTGPMEPNQSLAPFHEDGIGGAHVGWMCDLKPAVFAVRENWSDVGYPAELENADAFHCKRGNEK